MLVKCDGTEEEQTPLLFSGAVGIDKSVAEAVFWRGWEVLSTLASCLVAILCSESQSQTRPRSFTEDNAYHVRLIKHRDLSGYPEDLRLLKRQSGLRPDSLHAGGYAAAIFPTKAQTM